jgi:hypothetical protein
MDEHPGPCYLSVLDHRSRLTGSLVCDDNEYGSSNSDLTMTIEPPSTTPTSALSKPGSTRLLIRACFVVLLGSIAAVSAAQSPSPTSPWRLSWSDEFNAPNGSPPDPTKWAFVTGGKGFGNNELETYTTRPANAQQRDGNLVITAQKEDFTGADGIPRHYTSARIQTKALFSQAYGRFEASMQLPSGGKGIWPAFWLLGDNDDTAHWPNCGEIDIIENIGDPATIYSTIHGPGYSGAQRHQILLRRPPHRRAHPRRPPPRRPLGLRSPFLRPSQPGRRRRVARQSRRSHSLPPANARQLRPRLHP